MANLPNFNNSSTATDFSFKVDINQKPITEINNTVEKLNSSLSGFTKELKNTISGLTFQLEKNNSFLKKSSENNSNKTTEKFLKEIFPKNNNVQSEKLYSDLNKTFENFNNTIQTSFGKERTQSLFNLTFKQVAKDTLGTITDKIGSTFMNNPIMKGFTNLKDAFKVLRGGAAGLRGSAAGKRTERTQEQIELDREKIEREERTNEILEDILEALIGERKERKEKFNKDNMGQNNGGGFFPWFTMAGIAAGTAAANYLKDYPGVVSGIKTLSNLLNAIKNMEFPSIASVTKWVDDLKSIINTKIDDLSPKVAAWLDDLVKWSDDLKTSLGKKLNLFTTDLKFQEGWAATKNFFSNVSDNIFKKYKLPVLNKSFVDTWNLFSDFFKNLSKDIINKYNLPKVDQNFIKKFDVFTDFFKELKNLLTTAKFPTLSGLNDSIKFLQSGITNFINDSKNILNNVIKNIPIPKTIPSSSSPMSTKPSSSTSGVMGSVRAMDIPTSSSPSGLVSTAKQTVNAVGSTYPMTSKAKALAKSAIKSPFKAAFKSLPVAEVALTGIFDPEATGALTAEEAEAQDKYWQNMFEAMAVQTPYSFTPLGLSDAVFGQDTRAITRNAISDAHGELLALQEAGALNALQGDPKYMAALLAAKAGVKFFSEQYSDKYGKPSTWLKEVINWGKGYLRGYGQGIDAESIEKAAKLIISEEGMHEMAEPDLSKNGALVIGHGFNFYPDGTSVFDKNEEAKKSGAAINEMGTYLSMTEEQAGPILLEHVNKFHDSLLKIKDKVDGEFIGNIYSNMTDPARKAAVISLAYQVGMGKKKEDGSYDGIRAFRKMWSNINKANNSDNPRDWEAAGEEIRKSLGQQQMLDLQTGPKKKETRFDRAYKTMRDNKLSFKDGFDEENIKLFKAAGGAISYGPKLLLTGEYPNAKHNPELTAPINFIKDEMISTTERIVKEIAKENQINDMLRESTMEQRVMKMFVKSEEMSSRLKLKEGMETSKAKLAMPIINNVVDNKQVTTNNQSVLMKQTPYNPQNVFRLA